MRVRRAIQSELGTGKFVSILGTNIDMRVVIIRSSLTAFVNVFCSVTLSLGCCLTLTVSSTYTLVQLVLPKITELDHVAS